MVLEDRERDHYHHHDQKYIQEEEERHLLPSRLELHPMNSSPASSSTPSKLARFPSSIFQSQLKQQYLKIDNESHQYEDDESEIWWHYQLQRHFEDRRKWWTFDRKTDVMRWILTLIVGIFCGLIALFITYCTKYLTIRKFSFFYYLIEQEKQSLLPFGSSFLFLLLCHLLFAFISFLTTLSEPFVAGSGIPEVKCYLNGLNMPGLISTKTMILKAIGIVFACAAGLPLGKEGPMVHIGAVVAAEISQGKFFWDFSFNKFQDFRNDREKRDFVACGSAAGVAAAFGAPIGGVLFSLEESASYWSTKLTWRSFFCAMTTVFSLYAFNTAKSSFGHSDITAMFSFGEFFSLQGSESNYSFWELSLFIVIGCFGGFIGAFFNYCVQIISQWRILQEVKKSFIKRLTTVLTITTIMTVISYFLPILYTNCSPLPIDTDGWGEQEKGLVHQLIPLYCDKETEYNELATLYLTDSDTSIRQLFHFREVGDHKDYTFSASVLFLFFVPYITMACITYGTSVPSGMFVPSLLSGAAFGRMIGHLLHKLDRIHGTFADSGTYALMGAASMCAGISRMTISLTVMILEATGDMQYVLPLMLTILVARLIGNVFTEGIYDMQIHSNKLNFLDEEEELSKVSEWHDLLVSDVMTPSPICMKTVITVGECYDLLKQYRHVCFPIVDEEQNNILVGTVMTKVLCTLLKHKAYIPGFNSPMSVNNVKFATMLNWGTIEHVYPNYPKIDDIHIHEHERKYWLDLSPYLDYSPYLILESASVRRAYRMFRTLGLRQLCVINRLHQIVGIITREDLVITHRLHSESQQFLNSYQRLPLSGNSDEDIENLGSGIPSSPPKGVGIPPSSNGDHNEGNSNQDYNHNSFNGSPLTSSPQLSDKIMLGRNRRYTLSHTIDLRASI